MLIHRDTLIKIACPDSIYSCNNHQTSTSSLNHKIYTTIYEYSKPWHRDTLSPYTNIHPWMPSKHITHTPAHPRHTNRTCPRPVPAIRRLARHHDPAHRSEGAIRHRKTQPHTASIEDVGDLSQITHASPPA